jgi:hypothetical protein
MARRERSGCHRMEALGTSFLLPLVGLTLESQMKSQLLMSG